PTPPGGPFCLTAVDGRTSPRQAAVIEANRLVADRGRTTWDLNPQRVVSFDDGSLIILDETGGEVRALHIGRSDERRLVKVPVIPSGRESFEHVLLVARRPHRLVV